MFNADNVSINVSKSLILQHISEYDIWCKYCSNFEDFNKSFCSELYNDTNPSCRIQQMESGMLLYKDFGIGDTYSCFTYVMKKYNRSYTEALNIIANDFGILKISKCDDNIPFALGVESKVTIPVKTKSFISIISRAWNIVDYNYWNKYGITFDLLEFYNVAPCLHVYLHKVDKTVVYTHNNSNPIYSYRFTNDGKYSYKIYFPLTTNKKYKWLFSGGSQEDIEGFDQLPLFGELLIITKSLKDCIVYHMLGYSAISLQGEMNKLDNQLVTKLYKRFNKIVVQYDNDEAGIKAANKLHNIYKFPTYIIPIESGCKDLAEYIEKYQFIDTFRLVSEQWKL